MSPAITDGLLIPALGLVLMAWLVPKLLSMLLPEGVKPLFLNAFLSTLILFTLSTLFFFVLYLQSGVPFDQLADMGILSNLTFFGRLGLIAGLMWAPVMVLSVAALPRHWTKAVW